MYRCFMKSLFHCLVADICLALVFFGFAAQARGKDWLQLDMGTGYQHAFSWESTSAGNGSSARIFLSPGSRGGYLNLSPSTHSASQTFQFNKKMYDFAIGYTDTLLAGKPYALTYDLSYGFLHSPDVTDLSVFGESREAMLSLAFPDLLPRISVGDFTPYARFYYDQTVAEGNLEIGGKSLNLGLDYTPARSNDRYGVYLETYYNENTQPNIYTGRPYLATGLRSSIEWRGFNFMPSLNYQRNWESQTDPDSEQDFWFSFQVFRSIE